jgi:hypothetical protein
MNTRLSNQPFAQISKIRRIFVTICFALMMFSLAVYQTTPALAAGPETTSLYDLVSNGQAEAALQQVVSYAQQVGGWMPAPGDELAFDPYLKRNVRGSSLDYDELPNCADPLVATDEAACIAQFRALERQIRFGYSFFTTPGDDGTVTIRPALDDMISTYIEEVGHSWQEYQYETNGLGSGSRTRSTSKGESDRWAAGREYQIKRYILSLDGSLITLSGEQRENLRGQICLGYANPIGHEVPAYGAPQGWPNTQGWPTSAPTPAEFDAFCAGTNG